MIQYLGQVSTITVSIAAIAGIIYGVLKMKIREDMGIEFVKKDHCNVIHSQLVNDVKEIKDDIKYLIRKEMERNGDK